MHDQSIRLKPFDLVKKYENEVVPDIPINGPL
jgi:hypothetical protein